jgi:hypothetical protein
VSAVVGGASGGAFLSGRAMPVARVPSLRAAALTDRFPDLALASNLATAESALFIALWEDDGGAKTSAGIAASAAADAGI